MDARDVEALRETVDDLRLEVAELRASRERLVLAADADRRSLERDLHEGVQQHLVALAVKLQLASQAAAADSVETRAFLEELDRGVRQALVETAQLAQRIYPPLLGAGGLAAALRAATVSSGTLATVQVTAAASHPPELAGRTVYLCCREALARAGDGARATVTVRHEDDALAFEVVVADGDPAAAGGPSDVALERLRERVEALGGHLTLWSQPGRGTGISGRLPLSR